MLICESQIAAKLDVTKQKDLSGFYRNLYKQTTGDDPSVKTETERKEEKKEDQG